MFSVTGAQLKRVLCAGAFVAGTASAASAASVSGLQITEFARNDAAGAQAAYAAFLAGDGLANRTVASQRTETFAGFQAWNGTTGTTNPVNTQVGSFTTLGGTGRGHSAINGGTGLEVRNDNPFPWARHSVLNPGGNWLDSNDTYGMRWEVDGLSGRFNAVTFLLTDVADIGAKLSLTIGGTLYENVIGADGRTANGTIHLVRILLEGLVDSLVIQLRNDRLNDGFSLGAATVAQIAPVPLPPALALLLTGGLALISFRQRAVQQPT